MILSLVLPIVLTNPACGAKKRPNIVFILADDLGARDLSNEGSAYYESPHIDRISTMGTKFTRGYATCQVCSPSRASILTGKYPVNHGVTDWIGARTGEAWRRAKRHDSHLPPENADGLADAEVTLAEALRGAGYKTFFAGKWHLGAEGSRPEDHGFDINVGGWEAGSPHGGYFSPYRNPQLENGPPGESLPLRLAEETAEFIGENKDQPFFAYLSFYSVHGPIQTSSPLWGKYQNKAVAAGLAPKRFEFDRRLPVRVVQDCPIYGGMVESMDDAVGVVLKQLEESGLMETTIICFTSDNGGVSSGDSFATSNLPYRGGKGRQWEGGIREPYYVYAPGTSQPGAVTDIPASGIDWYPTLLDLAGVEVAPEQAVDGVSLVPVLKGESHESRALYWHYPHYGNQGGEPSSIIMQGDWKLIYYHEDERAELYNVSTDVGERKNLAEQEPQRTAAMQKQLLGWLKDNGAKFPVPDPQFDPAKREARLNTLRTKMMRRLERTAAKYLEDDYQPNDNWWGSAPDN